MKKIKKIIISVLIILTVLVYGCSSSNSGGSSGKQTKIPSIYTGTDGVSISFMKNTPPPKVYENQTFMVLLQIHNKGAYTLDKTKSDNKGYIHLDFDPFYFSSSIRTVEFTLQGKSEEFPKGESTTLDIAQIQVNPIIGTAQMPKTKITASVCYPYETTLTKEICIDQDYLQIQTNPICRNPGTYTFSSQGAPIAITKIESDMLPVGDVVQPVLRITIKNLGKGVVISKKEGRKVFELCSPVILKTEPDTFNMIKVNAWLGNQENLLKCEPKKPILINNELEVTCTINNENIRYIDPEAHSYNNNYVEFLTVKAEYIYKEFITKEIEIQRIYR